MGVRWELACLEVGHLTLGSAEIVFGEGDVRSRLRHVTSFSVSVVGLREKGRGSFE